MTSIKMSAHARTLLPARFTPSRVQIALKMERGWRRGVNECEDTAVCVELDGCCGVSFSFEKCPLQAKTIQRSSLRTAVGIIYESEREQ